MGRLGLDIKQSFIVAIVALAGASSSVDLGALALLLRTFRIGENPAAANQADVAYLC